MRRPLTAALAATLALSLCLPLPALGQAQGSSASLPDIEDEVMCPICGTTLEQSGSPQAERERELIRRLLAQGKSKDEIKDALVVEYGPDVLAVPDDEGFDLAAWLVPAIGLAIAAIAIGGVLLGRRGRPGEEPAAPELEPADAARLNEDMNRYDG